MAQLRLIGEPDEIAQIVAALRAVLDTADLSGPHSARNPAHVRIYGHVRPLATAPATLTAVQVHDGPELNGGRRRAIDR